MENNVFCKNTIVVHYFLQMNFIGKMAVFMQVSAAQSHYRQLTSQ